MIYLVYLAILSTFFSIQCMEVLLKGKGTTPSYYPILSPCDADFKCNQREALKKEFKETIESCLTSTQLHQAAFKGDLPQAASLMLKRNGSEHEPLTPLMCALAGNNKALVEFFIANDPESINRRDKWDRTALFFTAHASSDFFDILHTSGALIDEGNFYQDYYHSLSHCEHLAGTLSNEQIQSLKRQKIPFGELDHGFTLLDYALALGNAKLVRKILSVGAHIPHNIKTAGFSPYLRHIDVEMFKAFASYNAFDQIFSAEEKFGIEGSFFLLYIVVTGNNRALDETGTKCITTNEKLKYLLKQIINKKKPKEEQLLHAIIENKPSQIVSLISKKIVDSSEIGERMPFLPISYCAMVGNPETCRAYFNTMYPKGFNSSYLPRLEHNPIPASPFSKFLVSSYSIAHLAAAASNHDMLGELKKYGLDLNEGPDSPLFFAAESSSETVARLLELGANPNGIISGSNSIKPSHDTGMRAPICNTADNPEQKKILSLLLKAGASLQSLKRGNCNRVCDQPFIDGIIDSGISLDAENGTLLQVLIEKKCPEQALRLLQAGAVPIFFDSTGSTTLHQTANQISQSCKYNNQAKEWNTLLKTLVAKGALLNAKNALNKTALEVSLENNCAIAVVHLLAQNASTNFPSYQQHPCKNQIEEVKTCAHLYFLETNTSDCQSRVALFEQCLLQNKPLQIKIFETAEEFAPTIVFGFFGILIFWCCCMR